jgi:hypothetical protein
LGFKASIKKVTFVWKALSVIGLLFFTYCAVQIIARWQYRNAVEKGIWFVIIALGGGWCVSVLMR